LQPGDVDHDGNTVEIKWYWGTGDAGVSGEV